MPTKRTPAKAAKKSKTPYSPERIWDASIPAYTGDSLKMVSFPLGGIGTGTIGLGGRGELRDWEIFNSPNLDYRPPYTMPYLFLRQGKQTQAYVLERQLLPDFHRSGGLPPNQLPGLPRLKEALFVGTYPMGRIFFQDDRLPVEISLTAFTPMIPMQAEDSAIPAAILIYRIENTSKKPLEGTVALSMANMIGLAAGAVIDKSVNDFRCDSAGEGPALSGLYMTSQAFGPDQPGYGTMALSALARREQVTWLTDSGQHGWFDVGQKLWDDFSADGQLEGDHGKVGPFDRPKIPVGMLGVKFSLKPGQAIEAPFVISWCFPNRLPTWSGETPERFRAQPIRNHYAGLYSDAWTTAQHIAQNLPDLRQRTVEFEQALFDTTLPGHVLDAISSQMAIIRTNTTMWLDSPEDEAAGRIFAFEGCDPKSGCCPMNCTHVWNYEQSLAHLYPQLERTMRVTDYTSNLTAEGGMAFRTLLPLTQGVPLWRPDIPCADGQFGTVVKAHREWRISGDTAWLKGIWPHIKRSIEFAWKGSNGWDADKDGVMEGIQHNTYDIEFFGPNTMCGTLYLAALKAGAEMARALGEEATAKEFERIFQSGSKGYEKLFNGEYYIQDVIWQEGRFLAKDTQAYSDPKNMRYQYGKGCLSDQMLGQWAAHVANLGYVLDPKHVKKTMESIFRYNFRGSLEDHQNCQRVYALNNEAGLLLCTWPKGQRDAFPFPYCDEIWTGFEYQAAAHLIYEGLVEEGLAVVLGVRDRHDGVARNPWNEFECGDHYARALASWSVMLALCGQRYDGRSKTLTVRPVVPDQAFQCLFTAAEGYGTFAQQNGKKWTVRCLQGQVALQHLEVNKTAGKIGKLTAKVNGQAMACEVATTAQGMQFKLAQPVTLKAGDVLEVAAAGKVVGKKLPPA